MLAGIERILLDDTPDVVLVQGDYQRRAGRN